MFTNRDKKKYKEENVGIEHILPAHNTRRHRIFNAITKKVFGTSVYTREELVSFLRSLIRINYYSCIGNYKNNDGIINTTTYCKEDLHNFKLLGNKIKIKVTCEDNKMKEIKLKYFFRKKHETGYYLKDSLLNNEDIDKCIISDLLSFFKSYDIDIEKILPNIMLDDNKMLDNIYNIEDLSSDAKFVDTITDDKYITRDTKFNLIRRHSYKRPDQESFGNCWAWATVRMIIKFIQTIIKFNPHNEILNIEVSKNDMNYIYHFNNFTNFFTEYESQIPKNMYNEDNIQLKNVTIYIFCVLLIDHYNKDSKLQLNHELLLNPTKESTKRGLEITNVVISPFLKGIKNIKKTLDKLQFFNRFNFNEVQQNIIITFFEEFNSYMNDYNYKIEVKVFKIIKNEIYDINNNDDNNSLILKKDDKNIMKIINIIIDVIKKYNLYIKITIDLSKLPFLINEEFLKIQAIHALVITQYSSKKDEFTIENSWGNNTFNFILKTDELLQTIKKGKYTIIEYITPIKYKSYFRGYKKLSESFDRNTASIDSMEGYKSHIPIPIPKTKTITLNPHTSINHSRTYRSRTVGF